MPKAPQAHVPSKVLLVEDQTAIRQMLATLIGAMDGFLVVAQCDDASKALKLIEEHQPDVLVLDWMLAGETGAGLLRTLQKNAKRPGVLVFSANTTSHVVREAFALGALGFIEKTANFADFTVALQAVSQGRAHLGAAVSAVISKIVRDPGSRFSAISPREREILRLVAEGCSSKMIADRLNISIRTVNSHRSSLIRKTGLHSVAELTLFACEQGLITPPSVAT